MSIKTVSRGPDDLIFLPEHWTYLNEKAFERLILESACPSQPTATTPADSRELEQRYERYRQSVPAEQRLSHLVQCCERVEQGELPVWALVPYLLFDEDRQVVSTTALNVATLAAEPDIPMSGVDLILDWVARDRPVNQGAAVGGLLVSGDRRVIGQVEKQKAKYPVPLISEMVHCHSGMIYAAVVEFYLGWLFELDSERDEALYGVVAAGLANQLMGARKNEVLEVKRTFPLRNGHVVDIVGRWPVEHYATTIQSQLEELARSEKGEPIMPVILALWGLI